MTLLLHKRGSVALLTAVMAPVLIMTLALGVEVSFWSLKKVELQRIADVAAWAGAVQYVATTNAQSAANTAADVAEINGTTGGTRSWISPTLTDNSITAQVVVSGAGVKIAADPIVKVTVTQSIAKSLSRIFSSTQSSVTVSAVAVAEFSTTGAQPCILGLGGGDDGTTVGTDFTVNGNVSVTMTGCSVRADDGVVESGGSGTITASGIYAGGSITGSGFGATPLYPNAGQISDPYATDTTLQTDLTSVKSVTGQSIAVKSSDPITTINPGNYSGWDVKGTLNLAPGLYFVNGDIAVEAGATLTGSGVTIITSGTVTTTGTSTTTLTAPTTAQPNGAIPGIAIAGNTSGSTLSLMGSSSLSVTGLVYFPNAGLKFGGTPASAVSGCTEVIAKTVTLVGSSDMAANCTGYGLVSFGSLPGTGGVALVQ